jgi:hypothetical protein
MPKETAHHSANTETRAVANELTGRNGSAAFAATNAPAQLYKMEDREGITCRVSEDDQLAVPQNPQLRKYLFAADGAAVEVNALNNEGKIFDGATRYTIKVPHVNDCGLYARSILKEIHTIQKSEERLFEAQNVRGGPALITEDAFNELNEEGVAAPGLGEVYYAVNNSALREVREGIYYNFHWAVVVAESGDNVVTAEADPHQPEMWFQMYSRSSLAQSFKNHYIDKGKFDRTVKVFRAVFKKRQELHKQPEKKVVDEKKPGADSSNPFLID